MTPLFDQHSLERWFDHFQSKAENKILVLLQAGGEKFIDIARRNGSYKDQSSFIYRIYNCEKRRSGCRELY